ncbi:MAG: TRAP transporter substrate-binding protein DctP [Deltaproteobacteria bacterium]|nr:TRAP transporter substrate-binding protein DctP [Deltaproteobacteria bacterium]
MKKVIGIGLLLMVGLVFLWPRYGLAKTYKLKLQCVYPEKAYMGQTTKFFAKRVEELTNGKVKIKVFWPGQLVRTKEAFDALSKGMIDAYSGSMLYFAGYVPEVNCEWLPFGWASPVEAREMYEKRGWLDLMRAATDRHGVRYIAPLCVASMGLITKFPVHCVADLKGRKIRAVGMEAKIMDALGAAPVAIAGAEQYMALKRGTVEGTDYPFYTIGKYKFYEVCKYIVRPALHTPGIIEILMNKQAYGSLPGDYQAAVDRAGWEAFLRTVKLSPTWDEKAFKTCKEKNVTIIDLNEKAVANFRKATLPLWNKLEKRNPITGKLVTRLKAYLKEKGVQID